MKNKNRIRFFGIIAMVALIGLSMTSCSTDGNGIEPGILGTWNNTNTRYFEGRLVFNANGTFTRHVFEDGVWDMDGSGTFTANNGTLSMTFLGEPTVSGTYSIVGNNLLLTIPEWSMFGELYNR